MHILYIHRYTNDIQAMYEQYINHIKNDERWSVKYQYDGYLGSIYCETIIVAIITKIESASGSIGNIGI